MLHMRGSLNTRLGSHGLEPPCLPAPSSPGDVTGVTLYSQRQGERLTPPKYYMFSKLLLKLLKCFLKPFTLL